MNLLPLTCPSRAHAYDISRPNMRNAALLNRALLIERRMLPKHNEQIVSNVCIHENQVAEVLRTEHKKNRLV